MLSKTINKHTSQSLIRLFFLHQQNFYTSSPKQEVSKSVELHSPSIVAPANKRESALVYDAEEEKNYYRDALHLSTVGSSSQEEEFRREYNTLKLSLFPLCFLLLNEKYGSPLQNSTQGEEDPSKHYTFKDELLGKASTVQYKANNPIEDRCSCKPLKSVNGYFVAVFDGHGGWQVAEYAQKYLAHAVDAALLKNTSANQQGHALSDETVLKSIEQAFDAVENSFLEVARKAYVLGFAKAGRCGACALSAVVTNNKVYAANSGDSKGVIVEVDESGKATCRKINKAFSANSKKEQARLREAFPFDEDIIHCKESGACYVKGRLMPTRAFGDFKLKHKEFNNSNLFSEDVGFSRARRIIENFNGPYITHKPDIRTFDIHENDKYLILGSDGLWDEMTREQVADIVSKNLGNKAAINRELMNFSLRHAAQKANLTMEELLKLKFGPKRNVHDDISIIILDLKH